MKTQEATILTSGAVSVSWRGIRKPLSGGKMVGSFAILYGTILLGLPIGSDLSELVNQHETACRGCNEHESRIHTTVRRGGARSFSQALSARSSAQSLGGWWPRIGSTDRGRTEWLLDFLRLCSGLSSDLLFRRTR